MKKFFTTLAVGAFCVASASAQSFDNYTADPKEGVVSELTQISVTFPDCEEIEVNQSEGIMLIDSNYDEVAGSSKVKYGTNTLVFTLAEPATAPGTYTFIIGEGALGGYDAEYNSVDSPEMYLTYNIEGEVQGGGEVDFEGYVSDPAEGEVESLKVISVTFPNIADLDFNSRGDITVTHNGEAISGIKVAGGDNLTVTLPEEQTAPGVYVLTLPAESCCGFNSDYSKWLDNPQDIVLTWNIKNSADAVDFSYTVSPAVNATVGQLQQLTIDFAGLDKVRLTEGGLMSVSVGDATLNILKYGVSEGDKANQLLVVFSPAIVAEDADLAVKVNFPAGSLTGEKGTTTGTNSEAIELSYTVAPKVVYDLVAALSRPTNPNADGEISADKQLDSFFFSVDMPGLVAAEGTDNNVTIREVNGDFEASAHLRKAYGLDQSLSYFSAAFNKQPTYNGEYEIVIAKGAFGNELWGRDAELGHSNDEQTLKFTLVDGQDHLVSNLEPAEITPAEGSYGSGEAFATITVRFAEEGVTMSEAEMLYANLAGVDNDYNESATFTSGDGSSFTAKFDVAPTAKGTYKLTIYAGAFNCANRVSPEITREYILDDKDSVIEIELDSTAKQIYNLQGMPVSGKLPAGIYIIDGKKVRL